MSRFCGPLFLVYIYIFVLISISSYLVPCSVSFASNQYIGPKGPTGLVRKLVPPSGLQPPVFCTFFVSALGH